MNQLVIIVYLFLLCCYCFINTTTSLHSASVIVIFFSVNSYKIIHRFSIILLCSFFKVLTVSGTGALFCFPTVPGSVHQNSSVLLVFPLCSDQFLVVHDSLYIITDKK